MKYRILSAEEQYLVTRPVTVTPYQRGYHAAFNNRPYKPSHMPREDRKDYADGYDRGRRDRASADGMQ